MLEARLYIWNFTKKSSFTIVFLGIVRNFMSSWLIIFTRVFVLGWPISCFGKNLLRPSSQKTNLLSFLMTGCIRKYMPVAKDLYGNENATQAV